MSSTDVARRLDDIHQQIVQGSRTASRDLFVVALQSLKGFLARTQPTLDDDERHDIATDAILAYLNEPTRFDRKQSSLWTYLCTVAAADAIDVFRTQMRRSELLKERSSDVADWTPHPNHVSELEIATDARRILEMHGHRLVTDTIERRLLELILTGEKATGAYAEVLGVDRNDPDVEMLVKQSKDKMRLRIKRLRDAL